MFRCPEQRAAAPDGRIVDVEEDVTAQLLAGDEACVVGKNACRPVA